MFLMTGISYKRIVNPLLGKGLVLKTSFLLPGGPYKLLSIFISGLYRIFNGTNTFLDRILRRLDAARIIFTYCCTFGHIYVVQFK